MARKTKRPVGKKRKRLCRHCRKQFVPVGRTKLQTCPFCGLLTAKAESVSKLKRDAWRRFSRIVRFIDRHTGDAVERQICVTCWAGKLSKEMDAGHFMSRVYGHTFLYLPNVWPQCKQCNGQLTSHRDHPDVPMMRDRFKAFLREYVDPDEPDRLFRMAHQKPEKKWTVEELHRLNAEYIKVLTAKGLDFS